MTHGLVHASYSFASLAGCKTDFLCTHNVEVDSMCKEVPIEDPTKCPHAALWDGMTLETWKQQTLWTISKSTAIN